MSITGLLAKLRRSLRTKRGVTRAGFVGGAVPGAGLGYGLDRLIRSGGFLGKVRPDPRTAAEKKAFVYDALTRITDEARTKAVVPEGTTLREYVDNAHRYLRDSRGEATALVNRAGPVLAMAQSPNTFVANQASGAASGAMQGGVRFAMGRVSGQAKRLGIPDPFGGGGVLERMSGMSPLAQKAFLKKNVGVEPEQLRTLAKAGTRVVDASEQFAALPAGKKLQAWLGVLRGLRPDKRLITASEPFPEMRNSLGLLPGQVVDALPEAPVGLIPGMAGAMGLLGAAGGLGTFYGRKYLSARRARRVAGLAKTAGGSSVIEDTLSSLIMPIIKKRMLAGEFSDIASQRKILKRLARGEGVSRVRSSKGVSDLVVPGTADLAPFAPPYVALAKTLYPHAEPIAKSAYVGGMVASRTGQAAWRVAPDLYRLAPYGAEEVPGILARTGPAWEAVVDAARRASPTVQHLAPQEGIGIPGLIGTAGGIGGSLRLGLYHARRLAQGRRAAAARRLARNSAPSSVQQSA